MRTIQTRLFSSLYSEFQALIKPFQTVIYDKLRHQLLQSQQLGFLFPYVDYEEEIDYFHSLRIVPPTDPDNQPKIILYTDFQYSLKLEELNLHQLIQLSWQLSTFYQGKARLTIQHLDKPTATKSTIFNSVDEAYRTMLEQATAYSRSTYDLATPCWDGLNLQICYGKDVNQLSVASFTIEPICGRDADEFLIAPASDDPDQNQIPDTWYNEIEHTLATILGTTLLKDCLN